jgi:glycosidase
LDERLDARGFLQALGRLRSWYPGWATTAALNALSTHDTPRFLTTMGRDVRRWRLGMLALLTAEGVPQLYYGDEVGMEGGEDPDCRRPMEWDPARQNTETLATTRALTRMRREWPALRGSGFRPLPVAHSSVAAYLRGVSGYEELGVARLPTGARAIVLLNASDEPCEVTLDLTPSSRPGDLNWPSGVGALDLLSGQTHTGESHTLRLRLAPLDGTVLIPTT